MLRFRRARRLIATLVATTALLALMIAPAGAVTYGELDGDRHPHVGLMVAKDADGNPLFRLQRHAAVTDALSHGRPLHLRCGER
ncbi:MAG: hypothetical protein ACRDGB_05290 [Candidatus Limnocylindria bacterium]